jgi:hypothetical protein
VFVLSIKELIMEGLSEQKPLRKNIKSIDGDNIEELDGIKKKLKKNMGERTNKDADPRRLEK